MKCKYTAMTPPGDTVRPAVAPAGRAAHRGHFSRGFDVTAPPTFRINCLHNPCPQRNSIASYVPFMSAHIPTGPQVQALSPFGSPQCTTRSQGFCALRKSVLALMSMCGFEKWCCRQRAVLRPLMAHLSAVKELTLAHTDFFF